MIVDNPGNVHSCVMASCHTKGCDSLSLSKGRYDETSAGEDGVMVHDG